MVYRNVIKAISRSAEAFAELVYPADIYCVCCGRDIEPGALYSMCGDCLSAISWANDKTCAICGKALEDWYPASVCGECAANDRSYDRGLTCFQYKDLERGMIHEFKYRGKSFMARQFSDIMFDKAEALGWTGDIVIPVPMYRKKERRRGYNQAAVLARFTAVKLGVEYNGDILIRTRDTPPMSKLGARERRKNLEGAFLVTEYGRELLRGRNVMLVDDIYTMGVTAEYCSRALKEAGAVSVTVMSIAAGRNQRELPQVPEIKPE